MPSLFSETAERVRTSVPHHGEAVFSPDGAHVLLLPIDVRGDAPRVLCASTRTGEPLTSLDNVPACLGMAWLSNTHFVLARCENRTLQLTLHALPDGITESEADMGLLAVPTSVRFELSGQRKLLLVECQDAASNSSRDLFTVSLPDFAVRGRLSQLTLTGSQVGHLSQGPRLSPEADRVIGLVSGTGRLASQPALLRTVHLSDGVPTRTEDARAPILVPTPWFLWLSRDAMLTSAPNSRFADVRLVESNPRGAPIVRGIRQFPNGEFQLVPPHADAIDDDRRRVVFVTRAMEGTPLRNRNTKALVRVFDLGFRQVEYEIPTESQFQRGLQVCWGHNPNTLWQLRVHQSQVILEHIAMETGELTTAAQLALEDWNGPAEGMVKLPQAVALRAPRGVRAERTVLVDLD